MAVQGPIIEHGYEIDALDAPVLEYQLVLKLLSKALPNGPAQISGKRDIDLKEEKEGISLATPSAGGAIPEPWSLRGELTLEAPDIVNYKLTLRWRASNSAEISETTLVGELSKSANAKIDDSMSLEGWNLFGVGVQTRKTDSGTIFDYGGQWRTFERRSPGTTTLASRMGRKTLPDFGKKTASKDSVFRFCTMVRMANTQLHSAVRGAAATQQKNVLHSLQRIPIIG
jgi:hypothetical protein